jgi:hypothetical protein
MTLDYSLLGPEVQGFAPDAPPAGHVRLRVHNPREHWESAAACGDKIYPHLRSADGGIVCDVPREAVRGLLKAGYAIVTE